MDLPIEKFKEAARILKEAEIPIEEIHMGWHEQCYFDGWEAGLVAGLGELPECPYEPCTDQYEAWMDGWTSAVVETGYYQKDEEDD